MHSQGVPGKRGVLIPSVMALRETAMTAPLDQQGEPLLPPIGQKTVTKRRREEGIFPAVYHFPGESKHYFQILPDFFGKNVAFSDFRWYNDDGSLGAALCCPFSKK